MLCILDEYLLLSNIRLQVTPSAIGMAEPVARVVTIFDTNRGDCLGHGSSGIVFTVNANIAVKTACRYDIHPPEYAEEENRSILRIKEESAVFSILADRKNWHPNITLSFLYGPDYIFMERAQEDLYYHVTEKDPIKLHEIYLFLRELVDAISWLEQLGIVHADVRPPNILLSRDGHVKLCDFDNSCFFGQYIQAGNEPYYQQLDDFSYGIAGPTSEQGAIGCCAYFMCTSIEPEDRLHATDQFPVFGAIIRRCWDGEYQSVQDISRDICSVMKDEQIDGCRMPGNQKRLMSDEDYEMRVAECKHYLSLNGLDPDSANQHLMPTEAMTMQERANEKRSHGLAPC
ncbi:MAG: hypothetical protein Q9170_005614 [Blastenia crenularia]